MALRLLQEKTRSAASCQGSHSRARCSRGATRTGTRLGHPQAENVLRVVRDARRVAMAPYGIDFEDVLQVPVRERNASASMPVSSATSRTAVSRRVSPGSWLPVTDCQKPGRSARSSSSTSSAGVWITTSVETGIL